MPLQLRSLLLTLLLAPTFAGAALPELSSIEPLEFDEASQRLVARGDAELILGNARLRADRITYYQEFFLADAEGGVEATQDGLRVLAERASFDASTRTIAVNNFKTGRFPYYLEGVSAGGNREDFDLQDGTLWYGPPGPFTPNINLRSGRYTNEETIEINRARLAIGRFPMLVVPRYTQDLQNRPFGVSAAAGYRGDLGAYLQTETVAPVFDFLRLGANFDLYSDRGVLVGPVAQYRHVSGDHITRGSLSTGYIRDSGDRGLDTFDREITNDRGFVEFRHQQSYTERFALTSSISYWTDSEVTRDFRRRNYRDNQRPDSFVETSYAGDNYIVSAFGRFRPNNFQLVQERLPELRVDLLPTPILDTGVYQRGAVSYGRLRERYITETVPTSLRDSEIDRVDASYRVQRPFLINDWLTLTPLVGVRASHFSNNRLDPAINPDFDDRNFTRTVYELGFDLEGRAYASYPTQNRLWGIDGLRHIVRPVVRYRYFSDPGSQADNRIAAIDRNLFNLNRPVLDFSDIRSVDTLQETHLARFGIENQFLTRADGYGSRSLAELNFYQDVLFKRNQRFDGGREDTLNATWIELLLRPAHWLRFDIAARFKTEDLSLDELRTRLAVASGETWEVGISTDSLTEKIDQYRLDFIYRLSERYSLLADTQYDARSGRFIRSGIGIGTRIGNSWDIIYALTFREGARREDDVELSVRVNLAGQ